MRKLRKAMGNDPIKTVMIALMAAGVFSLGLISGAVFTYKTLNSRYYNEVRIADSAIWIRLKAVEGDKGDMMERVDHLARAIDQYDLAVAQIILYEKRQEIMNVRISGED